MNYQIRENMEITDLDKAFDSLQYGINIENLKVEDVIEFINTEKSTIFYLDNTMTGVSESNTSEAAYVWLDTGIVKGNEPQFISLLNREGFFSGFYVGSPRILSKAIIKYNPKNRKNIEQNLEKFMGKYERKTAERINKNLMDRYSVNEEKEEPRIIKRKENKVLSQPSVITEEVKNQLMVYNWITDSGLDRYIKIIGSRLQMLIKQKKEEYYILNNIRSAVVNTGLLNKFGADIYVLYKYNVSIEKYLAYKIVEGKNDIINENFTEEQAIKTIKPITFFDSKKYFEASIEKFDINYNAFMESLDNICQQATFGSKNTVNHIGSELSVGF